VNLPTKHHLGLFAAASTALPHLAPITLLPFTMNSMRGGMQVHAVPDNEKAFDASGRRLPWAFEYAEYVTAPKYCWSRMLIKS